MTKNIGAKRRAALKISSRFVGQWIVRPIVGAVICESQKLERLLDAIRLEAHARRSAINDGILKRIEEPEVSVETMARELATRADAVSSRGTGINENGQAGEAEND